MEAKTRIFGAKVRDVGEILSVRENLAMPRNIVIVGQLTSLTRAQAARVISIAGDVLTERVSHDTNLVIVGERGQLQRSGRPPIQLSRARRLIAEGAAIEITQEDNWLRSIGQNELAENLCQRFTAAQIATMLQISRAHVERWATVGLIPAVDSSLGIPLFDFHQVAAIRTLVELVRAGISLAKVRRAVHHLAKWSPGIAQPLAELSLDEEIQRLVVRTSDGSLAEPSGQRLLDFSDDPSAPVIAFSITENEADAFRRAVECEVERPEEAAKIYRELIMRRGPHAVLHYNLANALYAADDLDAALLEYENATRLDPQHVGAWNNLANVLAEVDRPKDAISAYRQALQINPRLSDARFNLAQTLVEIGRAEEAVLHWRAYLAADSESSWASYARERLEAVCPTD